MKSYIFDGSFEGLLTAIYESYLRHEKPAAIISDSYHQSSLFDSFVEIRSDTLKAERVYYAIKDRISQDALVNTFYVFLSELHERGNIIYNYLDLGWRVGSKIHLHLSDDRVLNVHNLCQKVRSERHRLLGLIRFRHLKGGIFYAPVEPDYNTVPLLASHFAKRLSDQDFIIHDCKRNIAALYNKKKWIITEFIMGEQPDLEEDESDYQRLWKEYCSSISIPGRVKPALQKRNMPVRYWKYLIEKLPF